MEFFAISGLLNGVASAGLALLIYFRSPRDPRYWTYAWFWSTIAFWSFGYFLWMGSTTYSQALFFSKVLMAGATFIAVAFLHHILSLIGKLEKFDTFLKVNYLLGGGFFVGVWSPYFIVNVEPILDFPFWPQPGFLFHAFLVWWVSILLFAHSLLWEQFRKGKGVGRRQYAFLLVASGIGFLGGATNFPLWYGIEIPPFGNIFVTVYVAIVGYTFLRYHLMGYSVFVEKGLSYFSLLLLVSQPVYPVLLLAQKSIFGGINIRFSVIQLIAHLLTVAGAYQIKLGTKGAVARTILKGREYRFKTLNQLSSKVSQGQDILDICQAILETMGKGLRASGGAILILRPDENKYQILSSFGFDNNCSLMKQGWEFFDEIPQFLLFHQSSISQKSMARFERGSWEQEVFLELQSNNLDLCHPVFSNNQLVGILVLAGIAKDGPFLIDGHGNTVWDTMLQESTLALENALLRQEIQQVRARLFQVNRMQSVEVMANELTQELLHPVISMKSFVQIAKLRRHDRDFMDGLSRMIGDDLSKIEKLTQEIREYIKPLGESPAIPADVHSTIQACLLFFSDNPAYNKISFLTVFCPSDVVVVMDRQSLIQVLFNVLLLLLKENHSSPKTLEVITELGSNGWGRIWSKVIIRWERDSSRQLLSSLELTGKSSNVMDIQGNSREVRGGELAKQIVQNFSGKLSFLTVQGSLYGVEIELPSHVLDVCQSHSPAGSFPTSVDSEVRGNSQI